MPLFSDTARGFIKKEGIRLAEITQRLVDFATKITFDQLPELVVRKTKQILLDSVGCALAGCVVDRSRIALELVNELGGKPQATIIGGNKTSYALAAFANGELINSLEYDPVGPQIPHVVPYVLPPSLAIGERVNASGKDLITAIALGLEIGGRVGSSLVQHRITKEEPPYYEWSPRFSWGSSIFGAVAGAGKLLRLNESQMANALGIAGASTPVPAAAKVQQTLGPLTMVKNNSWTGWVTQLATVAALAAARGLTGDTTILDGEWGFWKIWGSPFFKSDNLIGTLGEVWHLDEVTHKPYPVCSLNHASIEGIIKIMQENGITPEEIDEITIKADPILLTPSRAQTEIKSFADTQYANAYIAAMAVYYGKQPGPAWQFATTFNDPKIEAFMKKVKTAVHPKAEGAISNAAKSGRMTFFFGTSVEVTARGRKFVVEMDSPKGSKANPMTDEELIEKFKNNAGYSHLRSDKIEKVTEMIYHLEETDDIAKLMKLLAIE